MAKQTKIVTVVTITEEQADDIIQASVYADDVEDSEITEAGYVYTLTNGDAVVVTFDGRLLTVDELAALPDGIAADLAHDQGAEVVTRQAVAFDPDQVDDDAVNAAEDDEMRETGED